MPAHMTIARVRNDPASDNGFILATAIPVLHYSFHFTLLHCARCVLPSQELLVLIVNFPANAFPATSICLARGFGLYRPII